MYFIFGEEGFEAVITELSNGEESALAQLWEEVCVSCSKWKRWDVKEGGMSGLNGLAIRQLHFEAICCGRFVGAGAIQLKEVAGAARVCYSGGTS